jgi:hypothetical protein
MGGLPRSRQAALPARLAGRLAAVAAAGACVAGLVTVADVVRGPDEGARSTAASATAPSVPDAPLAGERAVATSFGMVAVHEPRLTRGITAKALAGQSHGINDYVPPERVLVQVPVTLYNAGDDPATYDSDRFRLVLRARGSKRDTGTAQVASSTLRSGSLATGASIDGDLAFVLPRRGADLYLLLRDGDQVHRIPVGDAGPIYQPQVGDHVHHGATHAHSRNSRR